MNFLAHIYLSFDDDELLIGNIAADFMSNKQVKQLSENQINGVLLHRHIDAYTDIHPMIRKATKRLRPSQSKYAPVVIDIINDYILAKHWKEFHDQDLDVFKHHVYQKIVANVQDLPKKPKDRLTNMSNGDFISSYQSLGGLNYVFERMDNRAKFQSNFTAATKIVQEDETFFTEAFFTFFPDMISKAKIFIHGVQDKL